MKKTLFKSVADAVLNKDNDELFEQVRLVVEERGVLSVPYMQVIKQIIDYTKNVFDSKKNDSLDVITITIPQEICSKIKFINDLSITINLYPTMTCDTRNDGLTTTYPTVDQNGNIDRAIINVDGSYLFFDGKAILLTLTLNNTLMHELNHLITYSKEVKNRGFDTIDRTQQAVNSSKLGFFRKILHYGQYDVESSMSRNITYIGHSDKDSVERMENFSYLVYRFFNENEINAHIEEVYADLESINSVRSKFSNDIKMISAFRSFNELSKEYKDTINSLNEDETSLAREAMIYAGFVDDSQCRNNKSFKNYIKNYIRHKLNVIMRKIGKVASYYYDTKEEASLLKEIYNETKGVYIDDGWK